MKESVSFERLLLELVIEQSLRSIVDQLFIEVLPDNVNKLCVYIDICGDIHALDKNLVVLDCHQGVEIKISQSFSFG